MLVDSLNFIPMFEFIIYQSCHTVLINSSYTLHKSESDHLIIKQGRNTIVKISQKWHSKPTKQGEVTTCLFKAFCKYETNKRSSIKRNKNSKKKTNIK